MAQLPVRVAADRVGITRQTMFKYIRQGKVSATVGRDGQKQIDVAELIRVFGELQEVPVIPSYSSDSRTLSPATTTTAATTTTTALQMELERMKAQLQFKEAELALAKERIDELKARELDAKHREREATEERMRMLGVIETQNRLLAAPPIKPAPRAARKTPISPAKPRTPTKPKATAAVVAVKKVKAAAPVKKAATASATTKAKRTSLKSEGWSEPKPKAPKSGVKATTKTKASKKAR